ncbi:MAG: hypothetical protein ACLFQA_11725 [Bacteroidales bacterium]
MSNKIMHTLFLSCLKATEIIEKGLNFKLSRKEKLQLKVHKMMCDACSRYEKQSLFLDKAIKAGHDLDSERDIEPARLEIKEIKERINKKLAEKNGYNH